MAKMVTITIPDEAARKLENLPDDVGTAPGQVRYYTLDSAGGELLLGLLKTHVKPPPEPVIN